MTPRRLIALATLTAVSLLSACASSSGALGRETELAGLEGSWARQDAPSPRVSVEREGRHRYEVEIGEDDTDYPLTILDMGDLDIAQVEIASTDGRTAFLFGSLRIQGDTLSFTPLRAEWLNAYAAGGSLTTAPVGPAGPPGTFVASGSAAAIRAMLEAAAKDPAAWNSAETWTRISR